MLQVRGELWEYPADAVCITTNGNTKRSGAAVMGAGCALEAAQRYPDLPDWLGESLRSAGNNVHYFVGMPEYAAIITFPTKHNYWEPSDLELIVRSATQLMKLLDTHDWNTVVLGRPGCGRGGLDWEVVRPRIETILDDRVHVITK